MRMDKRKNIMQLNKTSSMQTLESVRLEKRMRFVRRRSALILVTGLILIGFTTLPLIKNKKATNKLQEVQVEAKKELNEAKEASEILKYQVQLLEDEEYVAKLARKELNLSKENEILINLPEEDEEKNED